MKMSAIDQEKLKYSNIYEELERKAMALWAKGLEDEINLILSTEIEQEFRSYQK